MKLILVRHGQTPSNVAGLLDTAPPGPGLNEMGHRQAAAVAGALAHQSIDAVFASNQTRALQTAEPLAAARGLEIVTRVGLREVAAGELEMAGDAESVHRYIGTLIDWLGGDLRARIPGGPSGFEFLERYDEAVDSIVQSVIATAGPDGSAVAVSHGAAIRAWAAIRADNAALGVGRVDAHAAPPEVRHRHLDNTGAVELERTAAGSWTIRRWRAEALGAAEMDQPASSGPTS